MVTLLLDSSQLEVALSGTERALAFRKNAVRIDRAAIQKVQLTDDPWTWIRGVREAGTYLPGVVAAGTWHGIAGDEFVLVRARRAGVVIDIAEGAPFQRLVLTTRHGLALVKALRLDVEATPTDVIDIVATSEPKRAHTKPATRPATA